MREIKFRGWTKRLGMQYNLGINPGTHDEFTMQYTGLKAGKKKKYLEEDIYEGDIFRSENDEGREVYNVVMWLPQRAAFYMIPVEHYEVMKDNDVSKEKEFSWLFEDASLYDFALDCGSTKVGNVYENPELLRA